jgi:predicted MFS family arabinose efflux permease
VDKRKLLFLTQSLAGSLAATLGVLVVSGRVQLWMVYLFALLLGMVGSFDNPARQSFVMEMVGRNRLTNAVGLNSVMVNTARVVGPAVAGVVIVSVGIGLCFLINAVSYAALLTALALMRRDELESPDRQPRRRGQLIEGLAYVRAVPSLWVPLAMLAAISIFAYEFEVILPLVARFTFGGDADTFGLLFAVMGTGAVMGGLYTASRRHGTAADLSRIVLVFGIAMVAATVAPTLLTVMVALFFVGATGTSFLASANSHLQLSARPEMRGRVLSLRAVAFLGTRPIGALLVGWVGEHLGPRVGLGMGAAAALLVAGLSYRRLAAAQHPSAPGGVAPS